MNTATGAFAKSLKSKVVLIDGLIFQFYRGAPNGISRVWLNLIPYIQEQLQDYSIVVLRRGQYTSGLAGVLELPIPEYDFSDSSGGDRDAAALATLVAELKPVCFMSTYYSRAPGCPNLLLVHDMIPEAMHEDLSKPAWVAKKKAIDASAAFITVSDSTSRDLHKYYAVGQRRVTTAYNGISPGFRPAAADSARRYLASKGITGDYLLLVGGRGQYKGAARFLQAFAQTAYASKYRIVAVGGEPWRTPQEQTLGNMLQITYTGWITDEDLIQVYSGAFAFVYPSLYEGFGLPVAEAMACGCPVITPHHSSLPEVAGDAASYADCGDPRQLEAAIRKLEDPAGRANLIERGIRQAGKFSWSKAGDVFVQEIRNIGS